MVQFDPTIFNTGGLTIQSTGTCPPRIKKRLIVCCDGTWQDGLLMPNRWQYTNILRLARCIHSEDSRQNPPIPQIVFYQPGIGSDPNLYSYFQGTTGASLAEKVEEAYAFIAQNYHPGDEIFLFGFSRGAYTARMVAMFVCAIGVLNRTDMVNFAAIFVNFQKRGKTQDQATIKKLDEMLAVWTSPEAPGRKRVTSDETPFSIKCVGVFDTVGSLGLPEEISLQHKDITTIFGFSDSSLSADIENAFQALAINETRADFNCCKFQQTEEGRSKNQKLKQCWFPGSHSDIGGGWQDHDLADLTLTWMAGHIGSLLYLDLDYLASLYDPVAPWGHQQPHDPESGIFMLSHEITRQLPKSHDDITHETIHPTVLDQSKVLKMPTEDITSHPELVHDLTELEKQLRDQWPYDPNSPAAKAYTTRANSDNATPSLLARATKVASDVGHSVLESAFRTETIPDVEGPPVYQKTWLAKIAAETHLGPYLNAFEKEP